MHNTSNSTSRFQREELSRVKKIFFIQLLKSIVLIFSSLCVILILPFLFQFGWNMLIFYAIFIICIVLGLMEIIRAGRKFWAIWKSSH